MYQRRYDKVYLMLRQEAAGYGLGSRAPWGSCVMELKNGKGRLTVQVQGLRPLPQYDVYALLAQPQGRQTALHCAALQLDAQGSAKMEWDFLPDDLADGYQAEDLFAVLITTTMQGKQVAPLAAYFGARREWRSCFVQKDEKSSAEEKDLCAAEALPRTAYSKPPISKETPIHVIALPKEPPQEQPTEQAKTEAPNNPNAQAQSTESYHGNFRGLLQKFRDEMTQLQEMGILSEEESQRILGTQSTSSPMSEVMKEVVPERSSEPQSDMHDAQDVQDVQDMQDMQAAENNLPQPEQNTKETVQNIPPTQQTEQERTQARAAALQQRVEEQPTQKNPETPQTNIDWEILSNNQILTPFEDGAPWYCISLGELVLLPQAPLAWQKEPFFLLSYARYGHLILRENGDGFLFGLPDTYESSARRQAEQLGFATFVRLPQQETLGYWIGRL